jgi:hypothetical protein
MTDDARRLKSLASQYDAITPKLAKAREALTELIKVRDDYKKALIDQYDNLPSIDKDTKLADYMQQLQDQILQTKVFTSAIDKLGKAGLNKDTLKQLLDMGVDALPFASQLLDSGAEGINQINALEKQLNTAADNMGHFGAMNMYQAGVNAAQGLVNGLAAQQGAIDAQMLKIATAMAAAIKRSLGIRSPSRVFEEIGEWTTEGLVKGLDKTAAEAAKSAENVGLTATSALRKAIENAHLIVEKDMDLQPTIRPVLDLSGIKKQAGIEVSMAYLHAKSARFGFDKTREPGEEPPEAGGPRDFNFTQNNYSPKALSPAEIYRQTKNQLSTVKGALS